MLPWCAVSPVQDQQWRRVKSCQEALNGQTIPNKRAKVHVNSEMWNRKLKPLLADPENRGELLTLAWGSNWLTMSRGWRGVKTTSHKEECKWAYQVLGRYYFSVPWKCFSRSIIVAVTYQIILGNCYHHKPWFSSSSLLTHAPQLDPEQSAHSTRGWI